MTAALAVALPRAASAGPLPSNCSQSGGTVTCSYSYTGGEQTFTVPSGITSVQVTAIGAAGGADNLGNPGGLGAKVIGTLTGLHDGQILYVEVGQAPAAGSTTTAFNGGGAPGYSTAGGGGGASDVRTISKSLASRLIVAGGGGGHSETYHTAELPANAEANAEPDTATAYFGQGGFAGENGAAGGAAASNFSQAVGGTGSPGQGGSGAAGFPSGGGGGGGYVGGGGGGGGANNIGTGEAGGGGGGSSLVPNGGVDEGPNSSAASVTISYTLDHDLAIATHADITTDATSPSGATVTYKAPAVTDADDTSAPAAVCTPPSGSTFAIGTTTVTCKATDSDDTNSPVSTSFRVTVLGAADQLAALLQKVKGFNPVFGLAFTVRLAQQAVAQGHIHLACLLLTEFKIEAVFATSWSPTTTDALIDDAARIQAVLGCQTGFFTPGPD